MSRPFTMLLGEDNPDEAEALTKLILKLTEPGSVEIHHAATLLGTIEASKFLKPNVTLLDLNLDRPWNEVADAIEHDILPPVVVVTGMDDPNEEIAEYCYLRGAQNVIYKPTAIRLFSQRTTARRFLQFFAGDPDSRAFAAHVLSAATSADARVKLGQTAEEKKKQASNGRSN